MIESSVQVEEFSVDGTMDSFYTAMGGKMEHVGTSTG